MPKLVNGQTGLVTLSVTTLEKNIQNNTHKQEKGTHIFKHKHENFSMHILKVTMQGM